MEAHGRRAAAQLRQLQELPQHLPHHRPAWQRALMGLCRTHLNRQGEPQAHRRPSRRLHASHRQRGRRQDLARAAAHRRTHLQGRPVQERHDFLEYRQAEGRRNARPVPPRLRHRRRRHITGDAIHHARRRLHLVPTHHRLRWHQARRQAPLRALRVPFAGRERTLLPPAREPAHWYQPRHVQPRRRPDLVEGNGRTLGANGRPTSWAPPP